MEERVGLGRKIRAGPQGKTARWEKKEKDAVGRAEKRGASAGWWTRTWERVEAGRRAGRGGVGHGGVWDACWTERSRPRGKKKRRLLG